MLKRKYVVVISLLATVLVGSLFYYSLVQGQVPEYDPWIDYNDDGVIDGGDFFYLLKAWGTSGEPLTKASVTYDSGWVDITDKAGQYFNITHNLNSTDIIVDITGKTTPDNRAHQRDLGNIKYIPYHPVILLNSTNDPYWSETYGEANDDRAYSVIQTCDGGYAIAGYTYSFGEGDKDFWLIKTDWTGSMQWNKTYGGAIGEVPYSIIQTCDGGYAIAGRTASFGAGNRDFWLVKTNSTGHMQWNQTYGGTDHETAYSIVQTCDGGYAMVGATRSFGAGGIDVWLVKTDVNGNQEWNQTYGGVNEDDGRSVVQTCDGGYIIAGWTQSYGAGGIDFWLVKTNSTGGIEWNRAYGGAITERAYSVVQTCDGGYALAGYTSTFGNGIWDAWLVKTNSTGHMQWNRTHYGGSGDDGVYSMIQTSDGGYALGGYTKSYGVGSGDFWLIKTNSTGHMTWNKTYGGTNVDYAYSVIQTCDGGYALVGWTESFGKGSGDFWLVKAGAESGLAWTGSTADTITLYRGATDPYWNYVRVRIWKIKETP